MIEESLGKNRRPEKSLERLFLGIRKRASEYDGKIRDTTLNIKCCYVVKNENECHITLNVVCS